YPKPHAAKSSCPITTRTAKPTTTTMRLVGRSVPYSMGLPMPSKLSRAGLRLQPLSLQEAVAGPGLTGLDDVLRAMVQPSALARPGSVLPFMSPGVMMTPGDSTPPGELESPG